jgi:hypothetical protein
MQLRVTSLVLLAASVTAMASVDPVLLNLVMPDAKVLSGIQIDQSQSSPLGQYLLAQLPMDTAHLQRWVTLTGFDPRRDLHELLAAGPADMASSKGGLALKGLVLGRGTFQPDRITALATAAGATTSAYRGITLVTPAKEDVSIAFLDPSIVAIGPVDAIKGAIDRRIANSSFSGALAEKAVSSSTSNDVWFATTTPLVTFLSGQMGAGALGNGAPAQLLQTVREASGGLAFGSEMITISADAITASDKDAQALADVMTFLAGMLQNSKNPQAGLAAGVFDQAKFSASGPVMHFSMTVPEQKAEQLLKPRRAVR